MDTWLKVLLLAYLVSFFGTALAWRTYVVWRRTGVNPYVLGGGDSPRDFVGRLFRLTLVATAAATMVYVVAPQGHRWLVPIFWISHPVLVVAGLVLLGLAFGWVLVAQAQMGASWRIGIDEQSKTALVQTGLFAVSRNPIFLGMIAMLLGLVAVLPTAVTLAIGVLGLALVNIQVRLEEEYLANTYGELYRAYRGRVRRWL